MSEEITNQDKQNENEQNQNKIIEEQKKSQEFMKQFEGKDLPSTEDSNINSPIADLSKYYRFVRKCAICGIDYGDDCSKDVMLECPICRAKRTASKYGKIYKGRKGYRIEEILAKKIYSLRDSNAK